MTSYRRYIARYPFEARDNSEVTIEPEHTLIVGMTPEGLWPSQEKWMHGRNEVTDKEGDFPGNFVEFVEEFVEPEPNNEKALPPLPPVPVKPSTHASRGGVQVFPPSTSISPPPPPPHSATSPTHRSMGHSFSQGYVGSHPHSDDDEAPPPPPRRQAYAQQVPQQVQQENHVSSEESSPSQPGPPAPRPKVKPRNKRLSEPTKASNAIANQAEISHNWMTVTYQIPVECMACELMASWWL